MGEPSALGFRERGHAEASVQLIPLQRLEARADPPLQPGRAHSACCHLRAEDEDGERCSQEQQEPHSQSFLGFSLTLLAGFLFSRFDFSFKVF